jgi:acyl-CoA synthetase (AMP-forming)/AMP-acid ligase II
MPDRPLSIHAILEHAARAHPHKGIVSRDGPNIVRINYAAFAKRVAKLAYALDELGVRPGDRVASFAWNGHRHMELYYAVPMIGAVLHTVNIRLFPDQVAFILDHAEDRVVFFDASLTKAVQAARALQPQAQRVFVAMGALTEPFEGALDYETLVAAKPEHYEWPQVDERSAALLCYTSATTGDPKGVLFSHRSTYLHALASALPDFLADVSRQRLGISVHRSNGRRRSDHANGSSRRTGRDRTVQERTRNIFRRRADGVVGRARRAGCEQRSLARSQTRRHRRLGNAALALRFPRTARYRGRSRLGHDRDVADRHG